MSALMFPAGSVRIRMLSIIQRTTGWLPWTAILENFQIVLFVQKRLNSTVFGVSEAGAEIMRLNPAREVFCAVELEAVDSESDLVAKQFLFLFCGSGHVFVGQHLDLLVVDTDFMGVVWHVYILLFIMGGIFRPICVRLNV